jgi:hypothetical protein
MINPYKVFGRRELAPAKEFGEQVPYHADMLRYDLAFHDPTDLSRVVFPVFTGRDGSTLRKIT